MLLESVNMLPDLEDKTWLFPNVISLDSFICVYEKINLHKHPRSSYGKLKRCHDCHGWKKFWQISTPVTISQPTIISILKEFWNGSVSVLKHFCIDFIWLILILRSSWLKMYNSRSIIFNTIMLPLSTCTSWHTSVYSPSRSTPTSAASWHPSSVLPKGQTHKCRISLRFEKRCAKGRRTGQGERSPHA